MPSYAIKNPGSVDTWKAVNMLVMGQQANAVEAPIASNARTLSTNIIFFAEITRSSFVVRFSLPSSF